MVNVLLLLYYYMLSKKFLNYQRLLSHLIHFQISHDYFDFSCDMNTKISNYINNIGKIMEYISYVKSRGYKLSVLE
jgi:hypothetical protein